LCRRTPRARASVNVSTARTGDRKAALREAFDRTFADPDFLAGARQRGLAVNPVSGALDASADNVTEAVSALPPPRFVSKSVKMTSI
jgi:hypothetical protein